MALGAAPNTAPLSGRMAVSAVNFTNYAIEAVELLWMSAFYDQEPEIGPWNAYSPIEPIYCPSGSEQK
jgi:hypothetical protein